MNRLKQIFENLFQSNGESHEPRDSSADLDQTAVEIKGSIFALTLLFEIIAFTSYLPIDSFEIIQGRIQHVNNLGGIVGAVLAEWFLGSLGAAGYSLLILTALFSIVSFQGQRLRDQTYRIIGIILGTVLTSVLLYLLARDTYPEASLLQGGMVGKTVGALLMQYFNSTGSLVVLGGGYLITAILTFGFSLTELGSSLFPAEDLTKDPLSDETEEEPLPVAPKPKLAVAPLAAKPKKTRKKKSASKKTSDDDENALDENNTDPDSDSDNEATDPAINPLPNENAPYEFEALIPYTGNYSVPSPRLLKNASGNGKKLSRSDIKNNSRTLCEHLLSFQITGEVVDVTQGPVLTTYEYKPSAGVKLSKIAALQDDLGIVCGTSQLRIIAPIPGKTVVGIEIGRETPDVISLKEVVSEKGFSDKKLKIPIALGKATDGTPLFADLTAMPHLLVAGSTGSGKSVFVNCLIMSMLFRLSPRELRLILVDPKMLELNIFDGMPHLITPVITNNDIAYNALNWAVQEMDRRYQLMAETNSKNMESYNSKVSGTKKLPFIVIVVDELADLMMSGGQAVEIAITRLAQKARAAGIHMVIATQRPSTDVITGLIKANIPSRISFKVPSGIDSRTILDSSGAEELIGRGDSFMIQSGQQMRRMHACYVSEEDLAKVVKAVKQGKKHTDLFLNFPDTKPEK